MLRLCDDAHVLVENCAGTTNSPAMKAMKARSTRTCQPCQEMRTCVADMRLPAGDNSRKAADAKNRSMMKTVIRIAATGTYLTDTSPCRRRLVKIEPTPMAIVKTAMMRLATASSAARSDCT